MQAVVVFFVVSGLCIHLPQRKIYSSVEVLEFWCRRFVRLLIPMGIAILIAKVCAYELGLFKSKHPVESFGPELITICFIQLC